MREIQISLEQIKKNIDEVKKLQPKKEIFVVVKGNAYGHGMIPVVEGLMKQGINTFCVADIDEAKQLRMFNKDIKIILLYGLGWGKIADIKKYNIELTISNINFWRKNKEFIFKNSIKVHLKFDSGMHRMGIENIDDILEIRDSFINHNQVLEGLYTHISQYEVSYEQAWSQVKKFEDIVNKFNNCKINRIHYMNSASIQMFKTTFDNSIRIGNFLYGYYDFDKDYAKNHLSKYNIYENQIIKPILRLKTQIQEIKEVEPGEYIGYGSFKAKKKMKICYIDFAKLDGIIKTVNHKIRINDRIVFPITPPAMNHMFIELNDDDRVGDNIYLYEDLNFQANEMNCRPIDFIAYLDSSIKRTLVSHF